MKFLFFFLAVALLGCAGKTTTINTPDVDITDSDDHRKVNSVGRYEQCKKDLFAMLPADSSHPQYANWLLQIEERCHSRTARVGTGSVVPGVAGDLVPVPMSGRGFPGQFASWGPGAYPGLPGAQPALIPSSSGMWVPRPQSPSDTRDTELLMESQLNQEKRLCELEKQAGRPCKK